MRFCHRVELRAVRCDGMSWKKGREGIMRAQYRGLRILVRYISPPRRNGCSTHSNRVGVDMQASGGRTRRVAGGGLQCLQCL